MRTRFGVVRILVPILRWPSTFWLILLGLHGAGESSLKAPLQKEFFVPLFFTAWAILALVPFVLIRRSLAYRAYAAAFLLVLGFLCCDLLVPFRYLSPDYLSPNYDGPRWGEGVKLGRIGGGKGHPNDYWVTGAGLTEPGKLLFVVLLAWPLVLGTVYHRAYQRERRQA